jgi:hypothetical protein
MPHDRDHSQDPSHDQQQPSSSTAQTSGATDASRTRPSSGRPKILVDAANVAWTNRNGPHDRASFENLQQVCERLRQLGYDPIFIADASLRHDIDKPHELNRLEQDGTIMQSPAGTQADYFLLATARREHRQILSNDAFRDRQQEFPEAWQERVPFMIIDGQVVIDRERLRGPGHSAATWQA